MKQLKAMRSVRLATFRDELARLSEADQLSDDVQVMIEERDNWPRTDTLLTLGEARLSQHLDDATDLCTRLLDWIENHSDSSCEPEETFRSYIQEDIHRPRRLQRKRASGGNGSTSRAILGILWPVACSFLGECRVPNGDGSTQR